MNLDEDNFEFINRLSKEEKGDVLKAVRELVSKGRVMFAVERYKKEEVSLGKAAELAGLSVGQTKTTHGEFGVESNLEKEDYLAGLENLSRAW